MGIKKELRCYLVIIIGILQCIPTICIAADAPRITDLKIITLAPGMNKVEHFTPDGQDAEILVGWRDNGNAHGYDLYMITVPQESTGGWEVVGTLIKNGKNVELEDVLRDEPHAGEDFIKTIRFARGKLDGQPATFLIVAERKFSDKKFKSLYDATPVVIDTYYLRSRPEDEPVGITKLFFEQVQHIETKDHFCNSGLALSKTLNLPETPASQVNYLNKVDGCP